MFSTTGTRAFQLKTSFTVFKRLSSSLETKTKVESQSYFRCIEQNPLNHKLVHEAQLYIIPSEDHKKLLANSIGALNKTDIRNITTFDEFAVMIRKPALEILNYMNNANYLTPPVRYVLYGKVGCGKSFTMIHLLHYAMRKKWLIVHVGWAPMWIRWCREYCPSETRKGRIDQQKEATDWLKHFKSQNSELLKDPQLTTTNDYTWTQREVTEKGKPLMDIVDQGINRVKFASDCVAVLLKEIKILASDGRVRVFVGIHGANAFFGATRLQHEDKSPVEADDITLVHAFKKMLKNDWQNAAIVATVADIANPSETRQTPFPRYLLGKRGFELLDPFIPIPVGNLSQQEAHSLLDYYIDRNWIQIEGAASEEGKKQLMFLSGKNPGQLSTICKACVVATVVISVYLYHSAGVECTRCASDKQPRVRENDPRYVDRISALLSRLGNATATARKAKREVVDEDMRVPQYFYHKRRHHHGLEYLGDEGHREISVTSRISAQEMKQLCRQHCEKGDPGPHGPPGNPGYAGVKGEKGEMGFTGRQGDKGERGYQGHKGMQGIEGHRGLMGPKGIKGEPGEKAMKGMDGRAGMAGSPGLHGIPGDKGASGIPGLDGSPGTPGMPGRPGRNGTDGRNGTNGINGAAGPRGPPGLHGPRGKKGEDGTPGKNGVPGGQIWNASIDGSILLPAKFIDGWNKTVTVREEENVRISCDAIGIPEPKVVWQLEDGSAVPTGKWHDVVIVGRQLSLTRINRLQAGTYECSASNALPETVRKYITLNVVFKPYVVVDTSHVAPVNSSWVVLRCHVEMFPGPLRYWVHPNSRIVDSNSRFVITELVSNKYTVEMILNITKFQKNDDDYGDYKCFAKNDLGTAQGLIRVHKENEFTDYLEKPTQKPQINGQVPPPLVSFEELCPTHICPECDEIICIGGRRIFVASLPLHNHYDINWFNRFFLFFFSYPCMMTEIGKPVYQGIMNGLNVSFGAWMKDAATSDEQMAKRIWLIRQDNRNMLFEYDNKEDFQRALVKREIKLETPFVGNTHIVYNGSFYYTINSTQLAKLDLMKNQVQQYSLFYADKNTEHYLYYTNHSYVDFAADENGLWLIHGQKDSANTIVVKVSPDKLEPQRMWNLTLKHQSVGEMFIICGVLYAVSNVTSRTTLIQVAFDLYQNQMVKLPKLEFANPFKGTTMISYNHRDQQLLSWDKGNQLSYPLRTNLLTKNDLLFPKAKT
uniref:Small ribosomal subunit protein mS29 n=1 Tax=Strigamia maritima TaxID=126957 RepID=T1JN10_STRMM